MKVDGVKLSILESLKREGAMTVDQLKAMFRLSKTAMRAHLLRLEEGGMIERAQVDMAGPGRPPLAYRVTGRGSKVFPSEDGAILTGLLAFLNREGAQALVAAFFEEVWAERLAALRGALDVERLDDRPLPDRLAALEKLLDDSHFMPSIESTPREDGTTKVVVKECNCPLPAAVRATRLPCQLEKRFLEEAVGAPIEEASIASSPSEPCRFAFTVAPTQPQDDGGL